MATIKLKDYKIGFTDQFFFDTNVWLLLYGKIADYQANHQKQYSKFLEALITNDKPIYITAMVLSEISNVLLKLEFNQLISRNKLVGTNFKKDFVGSLEYKKTVESITSTINGILKLPNLTVVGDNFNAVDKKYILDCFKIIDFNDSYYAALAKLNNYKIVTNDSDFQKLEESIEIITAL